METEDLSSSIVHLAHRFEAIADTYVFKPLGVSAMSMRILRFLKDRGPLTPGDLIGMTHSTKSNLSQRLNFLEKEGYVTRIYAGDKWDKRKVTIRLTPTGKRMISDLERRFRKARISFEQKFSDREIAEHQAFIRKLSDIVDNSEDELQRIFNP